MANFCTAQHCTALHSKAQHSCIVQHICSLSLNIAAGWSDAQREEKRQELRFVLDATVCAQGGTIFYYQGLHDIASVLLLVMGGRTAYQTLTHLSLCQLRDCTRYSPYPANVLQKHRYHLVPGIQPLSGLCIVLCNCPAYHDLQQGCSKDRASKAS